MFSRDYIKEFQNIQSHFEYTALPRKIGLIFTSKINKLDMELDAIPN